MKNCWIALPLTLLSVPENPVFGNAHLYSDYFGCFCRGFDSWADGTLSLVDGWRYSGSSSYAAELAQERISRVSASWTQVRWELVSTFNQCFNGRSWCRNNCGWKLTGRSDVEVAAAARAEGHFFTLDLSLQICGNIHLEVILESFVLEPHCGTISTSSLICNLSRNKSDRLAHVVVDQIGCGLRHPLEIPVTSKWQDLPLE